MEIQFFNAIVSEQSTKINRNEVLDWFENMKNFVHYHNSKADDIFTEKYHLD